MDSQIKEQLQKCSKDEVSQSKLEELFGELFSKVIEANKQLGLLERAITRDYDSILITDLGLEKPGPKIVYVNDGFTKMTGYTKAEVFGKTPRILQGPKTDRHVLDRLKQRLIEGQAFFGHTVNYKKDGTEFINQWDIHPLTNVHGDVTHWVSYQSDITDRDQCNKVLSEAKIEFEMLEEDAARTYVELDDTGTILSSSRSFREAVGLHSDDLVSVKIWDLVSKEHKEEVEFLLGDFNPELEKEESYRWNFTTKKGKSVVLVVCLNCRKIEGETKIQLQFENLSLRNKLIEALKQKTLNLENLLVKSEEFTLKFKESDQKIICCHVSEPFKNITGYDCSQILDTGVNDILHPQSKTLVKEHILKAFNGEFSTAKCVYIKSDGSLLSVIQSFKPIRNELTSEVDIVKSVALLELEKEK